MEKQHIVQKGGPGADLFVYCHTDPVMVGKATAGRSNDAVAVEIWGEGTRRYAELLAHYGGYRPWIDGIAAQCGIAFFEHVCLATWSAGSQVAKDVCLGPEWPDAIVMLDGLYGDKPEGSQQGDGQVIVDDGLEAIAQYAIAAARGERTMVIFHSSIATPYASSAECAAAVERRVEEEIGEPLAPDPSADRAKLGSFTRAVARGDLHIVGFPGKGAQEHLREGALFQEAWRLWLPWARD